LCCGYRIEAEAPSAVPDVPIVQVVARVLTEKFVEQNEALVWIIPPLKKGGRGDFLQRIFLSAQTQIPLCPPFSKGDVLSILVNVFLGHVAEFITTSRAG
jgi:hypothetical protein